MILKVREFWKILFLYLGNYLKHWDKIYIIEQLDNSDLLFLYPKILSFRLLEIN